MIRKRFIAGASCPSCKEIDKIFTYEEAGKTFRACTRCEFNEEMRFQQHKTEITTRVNTSKVEREKQTQVVRFLDPSADH